MFIRYIQAQHSNTHSVTDMILDSPVARKYFAEYRESFYAF